MPPPLSVHQIFEPPRDTPPTLLVVIDTEEEFDWDAPFNRSNTGVRNIEQQGLAQAVFDRHGIVPTYAVDFPVAATPSAVDVLKPIFEAGRCDIGAHLHPWVNPPDEEAVSARHSFACNLPPGLMERKLRVLRDAITSSFGAAPLVYKAGRYGIGPNLPEVLRRLGFTADASVVPHSDFSGLEGPDFRSLPDRPFLAGDLAEVPLSVHFAGLAAPTGAWSFPWLERLQRFRLPGIASRLGILERLRLSPEGHDAAALQRQIQAGLAQGHRYFMLTYHSSSLMPGGSPYARNAAERDEIVERIRSFVAYFTSLPRWATTTVASLADTMRASCRR